MSTHSASQATPSAAVAAALGESAYNEIGTVYYWDETGSFSAESERPHPGTPSRPISVRGAMAGRAGTPAARVRTHRCAGRPASLSTEVPRRHR